MDLIEQYLEEEFIIWNEILGIRDFVTIGEVIQEDNKIKIFLDDPYDMVGPLDLKELLSNQEISFEACVVMTKENWYHHKEHLQQQAFKKQQKIQREFQEKLRKKNQNKQQQFNTKNQHSEKEYRKLLSLPIEGTLTITQIKTAYKKTAKSTHPDTGGDHNQFVLINEAKEILIQALK